MALRDVLWLCLGSVAGFCAGWIASPHPRVPALTWTQALAVPNWRESGSCVPPSDQERQAFEIAIATLENVASDRNVSWLDIGAEKFLSAPTYRHGSIPFVRVCTPTGTYERAAKAITDFQLLSRGRITEYGLELAARLPSGNPYLSDVVGKSAFNESPQASDLLPHQDIRPYARAVLASRGREDAEPYGEAAYKDMSSDDALGIGAAQVAVAAARPGALDRAQSLMEGLLNQVPHAKAVPLKTTDRLYELGYAIGFGGEAGRAYDAPIKDLMTRKVEILAPPFGVIDVNPTPMCEVLKAIEGPAGVDGYSFCAAPRGGTEN